VYDENRHLYEKDLRARLDFRFRVVDEAKAIRTQETRLWQLATSLECDSPRNQKILGGA
jgi:hypothetical protein